ncbi:MAG: hypothetical protein AAB091_04360, partial [Elusimicrobiota bacterium]
MSANGAQSDTVGNKMFAVRGTLKSDGTISWGTIRRQRAAYRSSKNTPGTRCWRYEGSNTAVRSFDPIGQAGAVVVYSSSTLGDYVALIGDAAGNLAANKGMGAMVVPNLKYDLSGYDGSLRVYSFCNDDDDATGHDPSWELPAGVTAVPVNGHDGASRFLIGLRDDNSRLMGATNNDGVGAIVYLSSFSKQVNDGRITGTTLAPEQDFNAVEDNPYRRLNAEDFKDNFGITALNEINTSTAHFAWVNDNGSLIYQRRASRDVFSNLIGISGSTSSISGARRPSLTVVDKLDNTRDVFIVWVSSNQERISYRAGPATATVHTEFRSTATWWKTDTADADGYYSLDNPKLSFWVKEPYPIGVMWESRDGVFFDKIINSTWTPPAITSVSSDPVTAPFTTNAYSLNINDAGSNFRSWDSSAPVVHLLNGSEIASGITTSSVTAASWGVTQANIVLSSYVTIGSSYSIRVTNPDGQETNTLFSITINSPTISNIIDVDSGSFVSCGSFPNDNSTSGNYCVISASGSFYQDWTGQAPGQGVAQSTNTLQLQSTAQITVSSLVYTYGGGAGVATRASYYLKVSTMNTGGVYDLTFLNPSGGSVTQGSTFYVTVPTATIAAPLPGATTWFTVVIGSYGYTPMASQTSSGTNIPTQVRITYLDSSPDMIWTGQSFLDETAGNFATEADKWQNGINLGFSSWTYTFFASDTVKVPYDGNYQFAARARTEDGGIGDPMFSNKVSTVAVTIDRFKPYIDKIYPSNDSAVRNSPPLYPQIKVGDIGSGLTTVQLLIQDIGFAGGSPDASDPATWLAFSTNGVLSAEAGLQIWMATATVSGLDTSKTIFNTGAFNSATAVQSTQTIILDNTTVGIVLPAFVDGHQYRISVKARDNAGNTPFERDISSNGADASAWRFIYDYTAPTMTLTMGTLGLMADTTQQVVDNNLFVNALSSIPGIVQDNVIGDSRDLRKIHVRLMRLNASNGINACLDPSGASNPQFQTSLDPNKGPTEANTCWYTPPNVTGNAWAWDNLDTTGSNIDDSNATYPFYRLEAYVEDGAGNSSGTASAPVYRKFFKLDKVVPLLNLMGVSTTSVAGTVLPYSNNSFYGLYLSTHSLNSIRGTSYDSNIVSTVSWAMCWNADSDCAFSYSTTTQKFQSGGLRWYIAGNTTSTKYQVWQSSGIVWDDTSVAGGRKYRLSVTAWDAAGNQASTQTFTFGYDVSMPSLTVTNISSGTTYGGNKPASIQGTAQDCPGNSGTSCIRDDADTRNSNLGQGDIYVGVRRQSDNRWFVRSGCAYCTCLGGADASWCSERFDPIAVYSSTPNWSQSLASNFWGSRSTETYFVYAWAQDRNYNDSNYDLRNSIASNTLTTVFHYETIPPSSTLIAPSYSLCSDGQGQWYSDAEGYTLPLIQGTAFDRPTISTTIGYGPSPSTYVWTSGAQTYYSYYADWAEVRVKELTVDGTICWSGSAFVTCSASSWKSMDLTASSFTYNLFAAPSLWAATAHNSTYQVSLRGLDNAIDLAYPPTTRKSHSDSTTVDSSPNIEVNLDADLEAGRNCRTFRVDKTSPTAKFLATGAGSLVNDNTYASSELSTISGTAADSGSGFFTSASSHVKVAYWQEESDSANGNCAGLTNLFWSTTAQAYTIAGSSHTPSTSAWISVYSFNGANPGDWSATGASTPTFTNACEYQAYVKAVDEAGLATPVPGAPGLGLSRVRIKIAQAAPVSVITVPTTDAQWYRTASTGTPNQLTQIAGTAGGGATNVRVQVIVSTGDANFPPPPPGDAADNRCWSGAGAGDTWLACSDGTFANASSTYVIVAVDGGNNWAWTMPGAFPGPYTNYPFKVRVQAYSGGDSQAGTTNISYKFDTTPPARAIIIPSPSSAAYNAGQLSTLRGTGNDLAPVSAAASGIDNTTYKFRIALTTAPSTMAWCPADLAYGNPSVCSNEDILAYYDQDNVVYSSSAYYMPWASSGPWRNGYSISVIIGANDSLKDLAQNAALELTAATFLYDMTAPTATLTIPRSDVTGSISYLATISGTVTDPDPKASDNNISPSGIYSATASSGVEVSIQILTDPSGLGNPGDYFYQPCGLGSGCWWSAEIWWPATNIQSNTDWTLPGPQVSTWSYSHSNWASVVDTNQKYVIRSRARDKAGNVQSSFTAITPNFSSATLSIDMSSPTIVISAPVDQGRYNIWPSSGNSLNTSDISGTATDNPSLTASGFVMGMDQDDARLELWYLQSGTSYYWSGSSWSFTGWGSPGVTYFPKGVSGAGATKDWSYDAKDKSDGGVIDWVSRGDRVYYLRAGAQDAAVDGSSGSARNLYDNAYAAISSFTVDVTNPVSTFTVPADGVMFLNSLTDIQGSANAALAGLQNGGTVQMWITRSGGGNTDWSGSSWTATSPWWFNVTINNDTSWQYSLPLSSLTDNTDYNFNVRAWDRAQNLQTTPANRFFKVDLTAPGITISTPAQSQGAAAPYSKSLYPPIDDTVSSRAITNVIWVDPYTDSGGNASGLTEAWIAISSGNARWWHAGAGSFFVGQSSVHWVSATVYSSSFMYTHANLSNAWTSGIKHTVFAKAKDTAGNWVGSVENPPANCEDTGSWRCQEILFDSTAPVSAITWPKATYNTVISSITGTSADPTGGLSASNINRVRLAVRCADGAPGGCADGNWWNWITPGYSLGSNTSGSAWRDVGGLSWSTITIPSGMFESGSTYTVVSRALDLASNEEPNGAAQGVAFLYDTVAPTATVVLPRPSTAYYNLPNITGTLYEELTPLSTIQIVLQKQGPVQYWNGTGWEGPGFNPDTHWRGATMFSSSWSIAAPVSIFIPGVNYWVYARAVDSAGNQGHLTDVAPTQGESVQFTWDTTPPASLSTAPANNTAYAAAFGAIFGTVSDIGGANPKEVFLRIKRSELGANATYYSRANEACVDNLWDTASSDFPISTIPVAGAWGVTDIKACKFAEGYRYDVITRARDNSRDGVVAEGQDSAYSQYENNLSTNSFVIDKSTPQHSVSVPPVAFLPGNPESTFNFYATITT